MGDWNNPVIVPAPQHRPSPWESTILPAMTQTLGHMAIQHVAQKAQEKQIALANKRQDEQKYNEMLATGGWRPPSPWASPENTFEIGGKRLEMAPISLEPFTGPDKKVVKGQYYVKGGGMSPQLVTIAPGWEGPFTSIGEGDRSRLPKDFVYQTKDGQTDILFDPTKNKPTIGQLKGDVFADLSKEDQEAIVKGGDKGKDAVFQQKIDKIVSDYGVSEQIATGIVTGAIKVKTDPITGAHTLVDLAKGTSQPLTEAAGQNQPEAPAPTAKDQQTIWDMIPLATGPVSAAKAAGSIATGMVGLPVASKTAQARQFIQSAQNDLIRSLSINPRFPVGEIDRIKEEINISPQVLDNPTLMKDRARAVDNYLRRRLAKEYSTVKNKNLPADYRQNAAAAASDIEFFLQQLGVPQGGGLGNKKVKADELEVGEVYEDANGRKAEYLGSGKWKILP